MSEENKNITAEKKPKNEVLSWAIVIGLAVIAAVLVRFFVATPYEIPSESMVDTIEIGDYVISEKLDYYIGVPQKGDIVTFQDPSQEGRVLIKRVIATEGQVVDLVEGKVIVDGVELDEPYTDGKESQPLESHGKNLTENVSYPYTVPDGCVWVMGDNRTSSADSRYFGAIKTSTITGKAVFRYWPFERIGTL